ncbi:MAG: acylneuraminate cytidylyltransferase family protein [Nitrospirae bacterium]|nr:acylneuraminate cytidylyltransferase family protein [Nitrospirota bacterium]
MKIIDKAAWGIITARGGSKSIPLKNIFQVCGRPLIEYTITAAKKAKNVSRIICSTDHKAIADTAASFGVETLWRPEHLSGDLVASIDVMVHVAETLEKQEGAVAEILILFQPTSIFVQSEQIDAAVSALLDNPEAKSSQTVVKVPHQFHAHNQRVMYDNGRDIGFVFPKEREIGYSKQTKPVYYTYGNLIVTRTIPLIEEKTFFGRPSIPIVIPLHTAYDLDGYDDIGMAELMIRNKLVHIE